MPWHCRSRAKGVLPLLPITLGVGQSITCELLEPAANSDFIAPAEIKLRASVFAANDEVAKVEFLKDGAVLASREAKPYEFLWSGVAPGSDQVIARAYGSNGATADSAPVTIKVAPLWVMLDPSTPEQLNAPGRAFLGAMTKAWQDSVERIESYAGSTLLGSGTAINPRFEWKDIPAGNYILTAKVYDSKGNSATSRPKTLNVLGPPTVQLIAPQNGATAPAGGSITLEAEATAPGSRVNNVVFYRGATQLGSDATAPYQYQWTNLPLGTQTLTANTITAQGWSATSAPITINVTNDPGASITAPRSGQSLPSGSPITVTVQATMPLRAIDRVEIFADGALLTTLTAPGASQVEATYTWSGARVGEHLLAATVYARDGTKVDAPSVKVTMLGVLSVVLESPFDGAIVQQSHPIHIAARASEEAGNLAAVQFYAGETLIGSVSTAPYVFTWSTAPIGDHLLTARAIDAIGQVVTTPPALLRVIGDLSIELDAGIENASVEDDRVSITGRVEGPTNSALMVNGRAATVTGTGLFFIDNIELKPGPNSVSLSLNTQDDAPLARNLVVTSTGLAPFTVSLDPVEGFAPMQTNLVITNRGKAIFQRIEIDTNGDGVPEHTLANLDNNQTSVPLAFVNAGIHSIDVKVFDAANIVIYHAWRRVYVYDPRNLASKVQFVFLGMQGRLRAGNVDGALNALTAGISDRFRSLFNLLGNDLPSAANQLGTIQTITVTGELAEILVMRGEGPGARTFPAYLLRGDDGIWRIDGM